MLSGCDKLPLTPRDVMEAANPLGVPVKEKVRDVEGGTLFRWTVEARREASWGQAMGVIRREFEYRCPDGQMARDERYSPSLDTSANDAYTRKHAAGTHFVLTHLCPSPPAFQFTFDELLGHDEAQALMRSRLLERAGGPLVMPVVLPLHVSEYSPLHESVRSNLAAFGHGKADECPDAFRFSYLSLGVQPQTVANENTPDAYLAFLVDCTDGLRSDPWPPGEPAS